MRKAQHRGLAIHTDDEFPRKQRLFVVPDARYAVLNDYYTDISALERAITILPITRNAVVRGSQKTGYTLHHAPEGGGPYRQIAEIQLVE